MRDVPYVDASVANLPDHCGYGDTTQASEEAPRTAQHLVQVRTGHTRAPGEKPQGSGSVRSGDQAAARGDVAKAPRPSVHQPLTKSYAIDQMDDIERLRTVAHTMWEAFYACHSQASHVYSGECQECNAYVDGDAEHGCDRYHDWQRLISRGFGSV